MEPLPRTFYDRDTLTVARALLGQLLVRTLDDGTRLSCQITETEAYIGRLDKACHAYGYRRTPRTETLFARPGTAYLYLIYGIYHCLKKVLKIAKEPISLETPIGDEEDSSLGDFIEDKKAVAPAEEVVNTKLSEQIASVLADLTPREEQVLRKRFGIGEKSDHTLEEVGKLFNVTRERIRQIEAKALRKLRHPVRSQVLRSFYDS